MSDLITVSNVENHTGRVPVRPWFMFSVHVEMRYLDLSLEYVWGKGFPDFSTPKTETLRRWSKSVKMCSLLSRASRTKISAWSLASCAETFWTVVLRLGCGFLLGASLFSGMKISSYPAKLHRVYGGDCIHKCRDSQCRTLSWSPAVSKKQKGLGEGWSPPEPDRGLKIGEATSSCIWDIPQGSELAAPIARRVQ